MILVVGATGYVGRYLCPYLKKKGYDVLALGRSKKGSEFLQKHGVDFQYFDLNEDNPFENLHIDGQIDGIVDLSACLAELETPVKRFFDINTLGVYKVLEFARIKGIKKVVITSSHKVYNDIDKKVISENDGISFKGDHSPYIISKIAAENFAEYYNKDFDMNAVVLRLTGVHGYGEILGKLYEDGSYTKSTFEIFFEKALVGDDIEVWGDQSIVRDHIYIKDVLSAIEAALNSCNVKGIFNIATGKGFSQLDEAKALAKIFSNGKESKVTNNVEKPGLTRGYIYDISKAERELNWKPVYDDMFKIYEDYKKEWMSKEYHNFHYIKETDRPKTL